MSKKVSFSKEVIVGDFDFNDFLTAAEIDIIHDCDQINESLEVFIEKFKNLINKRKQQRQDPDITQADIQRINKAINKFKYKKQNYAQIKMKIDEIKDLYIHLQNMYKLNQGNHFEIETVIKGPPMTQEEKEFINEMYESQREEPQDEELIHTQEMLEAELSHERHIEDITNKEFIPNILSSLKKFFMLQLTKLILQKRKYHEKEEDIIIQILGNIATAKEFYNMIQ